MNRLNENPFDSIAKQYDQWFDDNRVVFLSELEAIRRYIPEHGKGIDLGVGTGRFAAELGIKYGIDPSPEMAQFAIQRGIDVVTAKAENLPYSDESFDFAIMVTVDPFLDSLKDALNEAYRILNIVGKLIIGTLHIDGAIAQKYMQKSDSEVYKNARFHSVQEIVGQLENSGFQISDICQTLFSADPQKIEMPVPGHNKGSFVGIEAVKIA